MHGRVELCAFARSTSSICLAHAALMYASKCIQKFVEQVRAEMGSDSVVKDGKFGAMMEVDLCNDGPVTMQIEYPGLA